MINYVLYYYNNQFSNCDSKINFLPLFIPYTISYYSYYISLPTNMYVGDERFKKYYDKVQVGATQFLKNSILIYTNK